VPTVDYAELARHVTPLVFAQIAAMFAAGVKPAHYSSRKGGDRPDGFALERWQATCPTIPGAVRRGRWWTVSREAFEAFEAAQTSPAPSSAPAPTGWSLEQAYKSAGLRKIGGAS
jgi:hypothetical protein